MAAVFADCRMTLVGTGWSISSFFAQMGIENAPPLAGAPFLAFQAVLG